MDRKEVVKNVLGEFFNVSQEVDELFDDGFLGINVDEMDIQILSELIDQALEKEKQHENSNQS